MRMKNKTLHSLSITIGMLIITAGCDFTPKLHKEIMEAQSLIEEQDYSKSIEKYERIFKKDPSPTIKVKIAFQLAELYLIHMRDYKKAVYYFTLLSETTEDPLWLVKSEERMAEINYQYLKDYKKSIINYKKLINFTPRLSKYDFYQFRLANSYLNSNDLDLAYKEFFTIMKSRKHEYHIRSFYSLGLLEFQRKEWNKAIGFLKEYIKREKRRDNITQAKFLIGNAYETMEQLKKAYNIYYSILGEYPNTIVIQNRLNSIYKRKIARKR